MNTMQFGNLGPANDEIQTMIDHFRNTVEQNIGRNLNIYNAVSARMQMLAGGTNWLVKVNVGDDFFHLMINRVGGVQVPQPPRLTGLQQGHLADDPLAPFDENL